jgi:hypothetical protein
VRNDLEARPLEVRGKDCEVPLRIEHGRPRYVSRIPEVDLDGQFQARPAKERARSRGVERYCFTRLACPTKTGGMSWSASWARPP